jgi:hypothetical protein
MVTTPLKKPARKPEAIVMHFGIDGTYLRIGNAGRRNPPPDLFNRTFAVLGLIQSQKEKA